MEGDHTGLINRIYPTNFVSVCVCLHIGLPHLPHTSDFHAECRMKSGSSVYTILFLTSWLHYLWLFSADSGLRVCLLVWFRGQVTTEHCPDSLDSLLLWTCWVFRESEGGWGSCDCQGLHNCEWRNVLTLGTQKYFSCKYIESWGGMGKRNTM